MKMTDESMKQALEKYNNESGGPLYYCYGYVLAKAGVRLVTGAASSFLTKCYIIGVTRSQMILVQCSMTNEEIDHQIVPLYTIQKVKIHTGGFGLQKIITLVFEDNSKMTINANKTILGIKEQGRNLQSICDILSSLNRE